MAISKNKNGKFEVRVTTMIKGKLVEKRIRGLMTKGEARHEEDLLKKELAILKELGWHRKITWVESKDELCQRQQKKLSFSTFSSMKSILDLHTSIWADRPIDDFTTSEIEDLIETTYEEGSLESKKKLLNYIKSVFKRQIELGHLKSNPCGDLKYGKGAEKELIAMTRPEIELLLQKAKKVDHPWYAIWRVVYELGLRSGEGLALKWSDIDFSNSRVSINKSYCSKEKKIGTTKNKKVRTLPLNPNLSNFLKGLKLTNADAEFVLPQLIDWKRGYAAKILRTFQRDIGIRETNFHSLRASFITHLLLKGVAVTVVQTMVGHSDLKTTQRYVRLVASDLDGATDGISFDLSFDQLADVLPFTKEI
jgi:integrase